MRAVVTGDEETVDFIVLPVVIPAVIPAAKLAAEAVVTGEELEVDDLRVVLDVVEEDLVVVGVVVVVVVLVVDVVV